MEPLEQQLRQIIEYHNKQVANKKRGYPVATQNYFTVNQLIAIFKKQKAPSDCSMALDDLVADIKQ